MFPIVTLGQMVLSWYRADFYILKDVVITDTC